MSIIKKYKFIKYSDLIKKAQIDSVAFCGLHWEVAQYTLIKSIEDLIKRLPESDEKIVLEICETLKINISASEVARIEEQYFLLMRELYN